MATIGGALLIAVGLGISLPASADFFGDPGHVTQGYDLHQIAMIPYPAPFTTVASDDISWVDNNLDTYYLADRTNAGLDSANALTNTFGTVVGVGDFAGPAPTAPAGDACTGSKAGPNGVLSLTIDGVHQLWGSDGVSAAETVKTSNVKVFILNPGGLTSTAQPAATISTADAAFGTTGGCRADEVAYDARDHIFIVANNADTPPYLTEISVHANPAQDVILNQIKFNTTGGIEQTVWDQRTDRFFSNIPGTAAGQGIAQINPVTGMVENIYPTPNCTASGLALAPKTQRLFAVCGVNPEGSIVVDALTGQLISRIQQISGADEIWYDSGTNNVYYGANRLTSDENPIPTTPPILNFATPAIGVVNAGSRNRGFDEGGGDGGLPVWLENVPEGATTTNTHSVAADANNGEVFVPIVGVGIQVLANTPRT